MLVKFAVSNFRNFKERLELDLTGSGSYDFNDVALENGIVSKAMVYGVNGSGKSNLAFALFDIVLNLTDNFKMIDEYRDSYLNMDSGNGYAVFEYTFVFDGVEVSYKYAKTDAENLKGETLSIGGREVLRYDYGTKSGYVDLKGTEHLDISSVRSTISRVKYVRGNASLPETVENRAFLSFIDFVDRMLMFGSSGGNRYQGFQTGYVDSVEGIIREGKVKEFERFLRDNGINYNLVAEKVGNNDELFCCFKDGRLPFRKIASAGTVSLTVLYYWYLMLSGASLVYIDEFDAFYHYELATEVVKMLREKASVQVILSTHDTDVISNELLRPDCYFVIKGGKIKSFDRLTEMEIREEFNMQRMYKAGVFNE